MPITVAATIEDDGQITFTATPQAWRAIASGNASHFIRVLLADVGEDRAEPWMCGVKGATTHRACRVDTRHEPCPHHGEGSADNRCAAPTRKNAPCRWNLKVHGPCASHPETYSIYASKVRAAKAAKEVEEGRRENERRRLAEEAAQRAWQDGLLMPCTYCMADPGEPCQRPDGTDSERLHSLRQKLAGHTKTAKAATAPCPRCTVEPGHLCLTSSGAVSPDAHAHRL
ncbi:zinc finger domain-containing protein [Streptomyces vastus]|uniref:DNA-binding phage zinc finger domain-containing protein n=1 Tax=Streptomyces vastus TaxID=285451 RepID=A0ABP6DC11_9ACTN